jgi:multidrug transporter EmrE-like cation transporter
VVATAVQVVFNPYVFIGLCVFVISMASHLFVLSKVELSFAYPFLSLAYVVVLAYAFFIFGEDVGLARLAGVALICGGTILIAQS